MGQSPSKIGLGQRRPHENKAQVRACIRLFQWFVPLRSTCGHKSGAQESLDYSSLDSGAAAGLPTRGRKELGVSNGMACLDSHHFLDVPCSSDLALREPRMIHVLAWNC